MRFKKDDVVEFETKKGERLKGQIIQACFYSGDDVLSFYVTDGVERFIVDTAKIQVGKR